MVIDGSCTCEYSITYRVAEPLSCTPETCVTLCVNYMQITFLKYLFIFEKEHGAG